MKIAISLPDPLFEKAERYTNERGVARSQLIAEALEHYLARHDSEATTARLDEIYGADASGLEPGLLEAQAASLDDEAW